LPLFFQGYETALPEQTFVTSRLAGSAAKLALATIGAGLATLLLAGLWRERVAPRLVPADGRRDWARDAALLALALPLAAAGPTTLAGRLGLGAGGAGGPPMGLATLVPAVGEIAGARWSALAAAGALCAYLLVRERLRRDRWVLLFALGLVGVFALMSRSW